MKKYLLCLAMLVVVSITAKAQFSLFLETDHGSLTLVPGLFGVGRGAAQGPPFGFAQTLGPDCEGDFKSKGLRLPLHS